MEYKGHIVVTYREEDYYDNKPRMPHEIFVEVDGERVMSATELEEEYLIKIGDIPNWQWALGLYGKAYVDGMEE